MDRHVEVVSVERVYDGFLKVDQATVRYERPDGTQSEPTKRASLERGDSVGVLLQERSTGRLLFVRQFRYPTLRHGEPWLLEIVAGAIDPGETPEQAATREIEEEVGFRVERLEPLAEMYGSPGGLSEKIYIYFAEFEEEKRASEGGGLEGEDVERVDLSLEEALKMLDAGEIRDAKSQIALLRLRDRLNRA